MKINRACSDIIEGVEGIKRITRELKADLSGFRKLIDSEFSDTKFRDDSSDMY